MAQLEEFNFVSSDPAGNSIVRKDLRFLVHQLSSRPEVEAVVLEGSFGRGEGAVCRLAGQCRAVNDYDVMVVTDAPFKVDQKIDKQALLARLSADRLDIAYITRSELQRLKPTLQNFDRKYASLVIWGEDEVLETIPTWPASAIPIREAEKLLFTRLTGFLIAAITPAAGNQHELFLWRQQLAKAGVAVAEAQLILEGRYVSSYRRKQELLGSLQELTTEGRAIISSDFDFKLRPHGVRTADHQDFLARLEIYLAELERCGHSMYGSRYDSLESYNTCYLRSLRSVLIRTAEAMTGRRDMARSQFLNLAQLFYVLTIIKNDKRGFLIGRSRHYLQRADSAVEVESERGLRDAILSARLDD